MYKEIGDSRIHYHIVGEGKPVVLLHGMRCDYRVMTGCMEPEFAQFPGYQRIYIDLPGMGESRAPLESASSDGILKLLVDFIDEIVREPFLLVGESYGGYLAQGILASEGMARRTEGMLLICPVVVAQREARDLPAVHTRIYDSQFLARLLPEERSDFCQYAVVADSYTYERYKNEVVPGLQEGDNEFLDRLEEHYSFTFDLAETLHQLQYEKPMLLLTGRQDDCVGYRDLWRLLEDYPRAAFSVLDLAGHNLQIESPELFHSLVQDWLIRTGK